MVYDRIVMDSGQIDACVTRVAEAISAAYGPDDEFVAVVVLEGAARFASDLIQKVASAADVVFVRAASYHGGIASSGTVRLEGDISEKIPGRNVLIIDDIYDTGRTLAAIVQAVRCHGPADVKTCVLLEKDRPHEVPVAVDFIGTRIEDAFLIGYGLDYEGCYRDLPFIAAMTPVTDAKSGPPPS